MIHPKYYQTQINLVPLSFWLYIGRQGITEMFCKCVCQSDQRIPSLIVLWIYNWLAGKLTITKVGSTYLLLIFDNLYLNLLFFRV